MVGGLAWLVAQRGKKTEHPVERSCLLFHVRLIVTLDEDQSLIICKYLHSFHIMMLFDLPHATVLLLVAWLGQGVDATNESHRLLRAATKRNDLYRRNVRITKRFEAGLDYVEGELQYYNIYMMLTDNQRRMVGVEHRRSRHKSRSDPRNRS